MGWGLRCGCVCGDDAKGPLCRWLLADVEMPVGPAVPVGTVVPVAPVSPWSRVTPRAAGSRVSKVVS